MKHIIFICLLIVLNNLGLMAQKEMPSSTENIQDSAIVYPESMTETLSDLLRNWQLDLTDAELDCVKGQNIQFHDSIYINRLRNIPSELELTFNSVVKNYIEMYTVRKRDQVSYMLALGEYYYPMFEQALDRHGLPLELKYLPVIESALNPVAVSRVGATGLWQFMLRTGKGYGLEINSLVDERRDPYKSTEAAVLYLKDLFAIYGDWNLVIAAYNCGPGTLNKAIARSGGKRDYWQIYYHLPRETRGYVPAFIAANYVMHHYSDHNICPVHASTLSKVALDTVSVNKRIHLAQISGVLGISLDELQRWNPQYKKDIIPGDHQPYAVVLPTEKVFAFIENNDTIINYDKQRYFTHRSNTETLLNGDNSTSTSGNKANVYYKVKKGDNLSTIARRNGVTVDLLKSWNGLRSNNLSVGKQLIVRKKEVAPEVVQTSLAQVSNKTDDNSQLINKYYRVKKGDTLGEIARKNGIQLAQLQSWNGLKSSKIDIGDQLIVGQTVVVAAQKQSETDKKETYNRVETSGGSNIISSYLREQIEKAEQGNSQSSVNESNALVEEEGTQAQEEESGVEEANKSANSDQ